MERPSAKKDQVIHIVGPHGQQKTHLVKLAGDAGVASKFYRVIGDLKLDGSSNRDTILIVGSNINAVKAARNQYPHVKLICFSDITDQQFAVDCFRAGADDFLALQDGDVSLLSRLSLHLNSKCRSRTKGKTQSRLIGNSAQMSGIRDYIAKIADSDVTTLITGPTGSGKEVAALALHEQSSRANGPLIALNCAAIPADLIEGELFGYEKGAYTGATQSYPGKMKLADGGTLFLDEIGELSPAGQAKLLRAIETGEAFRLGARNASRFDVRILAATNRDLFSEMQEGRFRSDLYYRIAVAQIAMPSLSERPDDIISLARHFLRQMAERRTMPVPAFANCARRAMRGYGWPGNARELRNCVEISLLACEKGELRAEHLPAQIGRTAAEQTDTKDRYSTAKSEKQMLFDILRECRGNKSLAAKKLNWSRMTLYRKLDLYGGEGPDSQMTVTV
ncbi:Response regulator of zinc sigma-54-dependent two-component system [hydrothermal vent metagenome]|uniref:Response regulator of zinc sigma-54-dependent two-component system n=1 Tax=hydrothermal vent metagenome TaxID=652676 RepID=A0A3B0SRR1_9ZZZZ